jgi:hypothetical protein
MLRTLQRKLTRFFAVEENAQTLREEVFRNAYHKRMLSVEGALFPFSRRQMHVQNSEFVPARICGNCVHAGFHITRSRGISAFRCLCHSEGLFVEGQASWTLRMVSTVEDVVRVYGWRAFCKKESIHVAMFEVACASFRASTPQYKESVP